METTNDPFDMMDGYLSEQDKENIKSKPKKQDPHKAVKPNLSGRINKNRILIITICTLVFGTFLTQLAVKKKAKAEEDKTELVGGGKVPVFRKRQAGLQTENTETNEPEQASFTPQELPDTKIRQVSFRPDQKKNSTYKTEHRTINERRVSLSEEEILARKSAMVKEPDSVSKNNQNADVKSNIQEFIPYEGAGSISRTQQSESLPALAQNRIPAEANNEYMGQNMQENKKVFYGQNTQNISYAGVADEYTLITGTTIPAVTRGGVNSDLPGGVLAEVNANVYDSITGKNLLIPQGTKLIGTYNSVLSYGQSRLQVAWVKMIRPDGLIIELGNMPGTDAKGYSGIKGKVNEHPFQYLKALGLVSLMSVINFEFLNFINTSENPAAQNLATANMNATNQWGQEIITRAMDIQPTITVKPGTPIRVLVSTELRLPAVEKPEVKEKYTRK